MYRAFFGLGEAPFRITPDPRFLHHDPVVDGGAGRDHRAGSPSTPAFSSWSARSAPARPRSSASCSTRCRREVRTVLVLHPTVELRRDPRPRAARARHPGRRAATASVLLERLAEFLREHAPRRHRRRLLRRGAGAARLDARGAARAARPRRRRRAVPRCRSCSRASPSWTAGSRPRRSRRVRARVAVDRASRAAVAASGVAAYMRARLERAQARDPELFTAEAIERIAARSQGIPRVINVLCENALVAAFAEGQHRITAPLIDAVWADYAPLHRPEGTPMPVPRPRTRAVCEPRRRPTRRRARGSARRLALAAAAVALLALVPLLATRPWRDRRRRLAPEVRARRRLPSRHLPTAPGRSAPSADAGTHTGDRSRRSRCRRPARPAPRSCRPPRSKPSTSSIASGAPTRRATPTRCARCSRPTRFRRARSSTSTRRAAARWCTPADRLEAKPVGDRVTVRVPFLLSTHDDRGRAVRRQGVATWQIAMRDGNPRIVALAREAGPVPRR